MIANGDTIYALATAAGRAGIAIIRVSGEKSLPLLRQLTRADSGFEPALNRLSLYRFYRENGELIDEGMAVFFRAPRSYTGEDLLEIHAHGSEAIIKCFLEEISQTTATRMAEPGEFTRRALLNEKTDLIAAEALLDLVSARTDAQRRQALATTTERTLNKQVEAWQQRLVELLARCEAELEFPKSSTSKNHGCCPNHGAPLSRTWQRNWRVLLPIPRKENKLE